jgi:hypothetical protein
MTDEALFLVVKGLGQALDESQLCHGCLLELADALRALAYPCERLALLSLEARRRGLPSPGLAL